MSARYRIDVSPGWHIRDMRWVDGWLHVHIAKPSDDGFILNWVQLWSITDLQHVREATRNYRMDPRYGAWITLEYEGVFPPPSRPVRPIHNPVKPDYLP